MISVTSAITLNNAVYIDGTVAYVGLGAGSGLYGPLPFKFQTLPSYSETGYVYEGANHGFHNDTTPRYDDAAARLAWQRTLDFFESTLRG